MLDGFVKGWIDNEGTLEIVREQLKDGFASAAKAVSAQSRTFTGLPRYVTSLPIPASNFSGYLALRGQGGLPPTSTLAGIRLKVGALCLKLQGRWKSIRNTRS